MKKIFFVIVVSGCTLSTGSNDFLVKSAQSKQKQKIVFLQKKLEFAEKELKKAEEEVASLNEAVKEAELALVSKVVYEMESKLKKWEENPKRQIKLSEMELANLFIDEREILHRMIQDGSTPVSLEAQSVLDQILRLITHLSDDRVENI